ncbi:MAG: hypothetical protein IJV22_07950 [Bacteroidales bacterium]|nr:hypothetical protein [Bacteroidales bacterium]
MIPRTLHYCWFSGEPYPPLVRQCLRSWHRHLPDFTLRLWDGNSFDWTSVPYVKEAMSIKQYAYAADYIRLYALFTEGGIYLDTDVLVQKDMSAFLEQSLFVGTETWYKDWMRQTGTQYNLEAAILGSEPGHPFIEECLQWFDGRTFLNEEGRRDASVPTLPHIMSQVAEHYGYKHIDQEQHLPNGLHIYPTTVFTNTVQAQRANPRHAYAIHCNAGGWTGQTSRGRFYYWCVRHGIIHLYKKIETLRQHILHP